MPRKARFNNTEKESRVAISVRYVEKEVWEQFRRLAVIRNLTLQDYIKFLVEKDGGDVQVSIKSK